MKPMIEEKTHLDPNSAEGIANKLTELSKSNEASDKNLEALKKNLDKAYEMINNLQVNENTDPYTLDLEDLKKLRVLSDAMSDVKFPRGEIGKHTNYDPIKQKAASIKKSIPDVLGAINVTEQKVAFSNVSEFYSGSDSLFKTMLKTKFDKKTKFEGEDSSGKKVTVSKKEFNGLVKFNRKIAKRSVEEAIPKWNKRVDHASQEDKGLELASALTRGLTEGVGSQSDKLLTLAHRYLTALPDDPSFTGEKAHEKLEKFKKEKGAFLQEIKTKQNVASQTKKETGKDITAWSLHEMGTIDLIDFQNRLKAFIEDYNSSK